LHAQSLDAGRVLALLPQRDVTAPQSGAPAITIQSFNASASAMPGQAAQLQVKEFRIEGAQLLSQPRLESIVKPFAGKLMTVSQLQEVADAVTRAYQDAGYALAYAVVMPQPVNKGVVTLTVREGQLDRLEITSTDGSAVPGAVRDALAQSARQGDPVNIIALQESLLLIHDLPAKPRTTALIDPQASNDQSVIRVGYTPANRLDGTVQADNTGNRLLGDARLWGSVNVNNPLGMADQLSLTALTTGSLLRYGQAMYRAPVTARMRLGAAFSQVRYDLCCQGTSTADGAARTASLDVAYQWAMQSDRHVMLWGGVDGIKLTSQLGSITQSKRNIWAATVGAQGFWRDAGLNAWSYSLRGGRADLGGNAVDLAADQSATGAQVHGSFTKINGSFYRLQTVSPRWALFANVRAQANLERNLESAERISLGGVDGVRAYALGEGTGDSGLLANLELRYAFADVAGLTVAGLLDAGNVMRFSKNASALAGAVPNTYSLLGVGLGLRYEHPSASVSLIVARPLGGNPGADPTGTNAEGKSDGARGWVTVAWKF
jgi:hemolysin activation/secretion protein